MGVQPENIDFLMRNDKDKSVGGFRTIGTSCEGNYNDDANKAFETDMIYENKNNDSIVEEKSEGNDATTYNDSRCFTQMMDFMNG